MVYVDINPIDCYTEFKEEEEYRNNRKNPVRITYYRFIISVYSITIYKSEWYTGYVDSNSEDRVKQAWRNKWEQFLAESFKEWSQRYGAGEEE